MSDFSTKNISPALIEEIRQALLGLDYGSLEIFVSNGEVSQITQRKIKKTNGVVKNGRGLRVGKK